MKDKSMAVLGIGTAQALGFYLIPILHVVDKSTPSSINRTLQMIQKKTHMYKTNCTKHSVSATYIIESRFS